MLTQAFEQAWINDFEKLDSRDLKIKRVQELVNLTRENLKQEIVEVLEKLE